MKIKLFQVDAFTDQLFAGNPAAVCPLEAWLPTATMQAIAQENNLSETAFFVRENNEYSIRWFTPTAEVDLCGHATLAAAYVILQLLEPGLNKISFLSVSGRLMVERYADFLQLDFPAIPVVACATPIDLVAGLGVIPTAVYHSPKSYLALLANAAQVQQLVPHMTELAKLDRRAVIVTAPGDEQIDFVSRYFVPASYKEDSATGIAHCSLIPFWTLRLHKTVLTARQLSQRGGHFSGEWHDDRVFLRGKAIIYLTGVINI